MKHFGILLLVAMGLGSCGAAMDYSSSVNKQEAFRIGKAVTPEKERARLITMLRKMNRTHHKKALNEIAAR